MSRSRQRIHRTVFLLTLLVAVGPLTVLQMVAWTGMLWSYSKDQGVMLAVVDTFSGEKPCALCLQIQEVREEAPQDTATITWGVNGWLLPLCGQATLLIPPTDAIVMSPESIHYPIGDCREVLLPPPIQELS